MPDEIKVIMAGPRPKAVIGSSGLPTQLPGACITADAIGNPLGKGRNLSGVAIDETKENQ